MNTDSAIHAAVLGVGAAYVQASLDDLYLGDVVRRVGRPLQVGRVVQVIEHNVLVRWYAGGPVDTQPVTRLQRRIER